MKNPNTLLGTLVLTSGLLLCGCGDDMKQQSTTMASMAPTLGVNSDQPATMDLESTIKNWPQKPKDAVMTVRKKYGEPEIISEHMIAWKNTGQFKFTKIMDKEFPHDFPVAHTDFMEQGLDHKVPVNMVGPLAEFDGSVIVDRTTGCLSARCDIEAHNTLALNLAHDVITGKSSPAEARTRFANIVAKEMAGQSDPYLEKLQFSADSDAGDKDMMVKPTAMVKDKM